MDNTRNNAGNTRGRPFAIGNPGRPAGSLNKTTIAVQSLLDGEAEALTRKAVELALSGNIAALKLCLERICPPQRERPLAVELPIIGSAAELPHLTSAILAAVGRGELESTQASALAALAATHGKVLELSELEKRIAALERNK